MYYNDYFRNDESVENENEYSTTEFEQGELPPCCPYRQFTQETENNEDYYMRAPMPSGPPPSFVPQEGGAGVQGFSAPGGPGGPTKLVEQGAIRPCLYRSIYIWPRRGKGFWAFLTFVGRRSVSGFRWQGRRWIYFGMDLRDIRSFQCF